MVKSNKMTTTLSIIFMIINTLVVFCIAGFPNSRICELHFYEKYGWEVFPHDTVTIENDIETEVVGVIGIEPENGAAPVAEGDIVTLSAGTQVRLSTHIDDHTVRVSSSDLNASYIIDIADLVESDEEMINEWNAKHDEAQAKGKEDYAKYQKGMKYWFINPPYVLAGLLGAVLFILVDMVIFQSKKARFIHLILNIAALPVLAFWLFQVMTHISTCK